MEIDLIGAERLPLSMLTELWNRGFQDYYVPMHLTPARLSALVRRELISLPDSLVALAEGQPVGFALAALRWQGDSLLAYDAGTAVLPTHRNRGIASRLMQALLERLFVIGSQEISLTVVSDNQKAIALYQRQGFTVQRQLTCFEQRSASQPSLQQPAGLSIEPVPEAVVRPLIDACYRQSPDWQNRPQGAKMRESRALLATWQDSPVGYAILAGQGPIYLHQLGVLPEWRRRGFGRALFDTLMATNQSNRCIYLNHPEEETEATAWLHQMGFYVFLRQVEMHHELFPVWRPRLAKEQDLPRIEHVLREAGLPTIGTAGSVPTIWMLNDNAGDLLGLVGAQTAGETVLLRALWVRADQRGRGLGRQLIEHEERWLRSHGCTDLYLMSMGDGMLFKYLGYTAKRPEQLPQAIRQLIALQGFCPLTAVPMHKLL